MWCPRNFLHKYFLGFVDVPAGGDLVREAGWQAQASADGCAEEPDHVALFCPLPADLRTALAELTACNEESRARVAVWLSGDATPLSSELRIEHARRPRKTTGLAIDAYRKQCEPDTARVKKSRTEGGRCSVPLVEDETTQRRRKNRL
eukprot:gnl/TRDRNA2_/TRDRNA2_118668_c2_seq1.p1 gnl/TRDRNA2_/TRDRNA2_118668_c2~~gnl/TRDRNA2_/TRDRNA2_118668_c2_seq1.p1  ORF type:complete len:148 (+),score=19.67 gnl/TRDRNA2_/TRDRNA2_118668_c2_seq1:80-523(+)